MVRERKVILMEFNNRPTSLGLSTLMVCRFIKTIIVNYKVELGSFITHVKRRLKSKNKLKNIYDHSRLKKRV
jgi:hypothetical protein